MASIRETPLAGGPAGAQRTLPASGNLSADPRNLPVGEVLAARVVAGEAGQDLLLELAGQRVSVPTRLELPPGSVLSVRVERGSEGVRLAPVTTEASQQLPEAVAEALRQALPRQTSLALLLPLLARLTGAPLPLALIAPGDPGTPASVAPGATPAAAARSAVPPLVPATGSTAIPAALDPGASEDSPSPGPIAPALGPSTAATPADHGLDPRLPSLEALLQAAQPRPPSTGAADSRPLPAAAIAAHLLEERPTRVPASGSDPLVESPPSPTGRRGGESTLGGGTGSADPGGGARLAGGALHLPPRVAAALLALAEQVPASAELRDGARLARVVARAGLMLEARLAAEQPPATAEIAADLKAALLRVRASVEEPGQPRPGGDGALAPGGTAAGATAEADRAALLQALGESVDGTLARIAVNQLQIASTTDTAPLAFSFEIPLRDPDGRYHPLAFEFEREAEDPARQHSATSTVTLRMHPAGLGPMTAVLRLCGEHLVTELWAGEAATRALLHEAQDGLAARLRAAGLEVTAIRLTGHPPPGPPSATGLATSLIQTTV